MKFEMESSIHLIGERVLNISIQVDDVTLNVVNKAIEEADQFVRLFLEAEMERYHFTMSPLIQFSSSKLDEGYQQAQFYLSKFNVNQLDYIKMTEDEKSWKEIASIVIEDAMIVSRFIRDALINYYQQLEG